MSEKKTLGHVIYMIRMNEGLTQEELATIAGVSGRSVVSYWEANKSKPNPKALKRIADLNHQTVSDLLEQVGG